MYWRYAKTIFLPKIQGDGKILKIVVAHEKEVDILADGDDRMDTPMEPLKVITVRGSFIVTLISRSGIGTVQDQTNVVVRHFCQE